MEIVKGFFDYCISDKCVTSGGFENVAKRLLQLGYRTIAINQIIDDSNVEPKKKKKKGEVRDIADVVPVPLEVRTIQLKSANYRKYHIVAVQPTSQAAFQFTCSSFDADIFTYDPENKPEFKMNRRLYNQLVEKGFYFELLYSPAVQDSSQRKNVIAVSHLYHSFGRSKNIIISSGASNSFLLRSPYDIINLGFIFGLSEEQAKNAIESFGRNVYLRGVGRRHGKVIMLVQDTGEAVEDMESSALEQDDEMELDQPAQKKSKL